MLRRSVRTLGGLLGGQQPTLLQRVSAAARGTQVESMALKLALSSFNGAAERRLTVSRTLPSKARSPVLSFRTPPRRTFHSTKTRKSQTQSQSAKGEAAGEGAGPGAAAAEPLSLSARLKKLSREYGWAAVGVYFGLSLLDFPFCFLLVRTVGTDKIAAVEHVVVKYVSAIIPASVKELWHNYRSGPEETGKKSGNATGEEGAEGWGVKEADERNKRAASLATQLALAYAIHKSFIFVRVPLTAAVTPKVVRVLRNWGWKIGKKVPGK